MEELVQFVTGAYDEIYMKISQHKTQVVGVAGAREGEKVDMEGREIEI